jgi:hypothetical protein
MESGFYVWGVYSADGSTFYYLQSSSSSSAFGASSDNRPFSNASFLAGVITKGFLGLPDLVSLTGTSEGTGCGFHYGERCVHGSWRNQEK